MSLMLASLRPPAKRSGKRFGAPTLLDSNVLYEGGVCDRNCFCTGTTPAQAVELIIDYAMKKWGNKVYVLAADYNYGQIAAQWVAHYVEERKGSVLATNFFPLDVWILRF